MSSMKRESNSRATKSLSRRDFLAFLAGAGAALSWITRLRRDAAGTIARPQPVVSIHMDQPYLDWTGTAMPYYPPAGVRSGEVLAKLSEESLRLKHCYL